LTEQQKGLKKTNPEAGNLMKNDSRGNHEKLGEEGGKNQVQGFLGGGGGLGGGGRGGGGGGGGGGLWGVVGGLGAGLLRKKGAGSENQRLERKKGHIPKEARNGKEKDSQDGQRESGGNSPGTSRGGGFRKGGEPRKKKGGEGC